MAAEAAVVARTVADGLVNLLGLLGLLDGVVEFFEGFEGLVGFPEDVLDELGGLTGGRN